jgi:hypothetical protein
MDPYAVLGVRPGSPEAAIAAAYRDQAKRWHPDTGAGAEGERRMAELNVAYDVIRAGAQQPPLPRAERSSPLRSPAPGARPARGAWLPEWIRRALGHELLEALGEGEEVRLVTPASTWASPRAILAVTERRLLWLLDDAPVARVRSIPFRSVAGVEHRSARRNKHATLTVRTLAGQRHAFHDLRPHTAATIARHLRERG